MAGKPEAEIPVYIRTCSGVNTMTLRTSVVSRSMQPGRRQHHALLTLISRVVASFAIAASMPVTAHAANKTTTPANEKAAIFFPLGYANGNSADEKELIKYFTEQLTLESYIVTPFVDETGADDDDPQRATATNFLQLGDFAVVLVATHGQEDNLMVEVYSSEGARDKKWKDVYGFPDAPTKPWQKGDLIQCDGGVDITHKPDPIRIYGICITAQGIKNNITKGPTVLELASCLAFGLKDDFGAVREFFGYDAKECPSTTIKPDSMLLWGRMSGTKDKGEHRPADAAYQAGQFSDHFKFQHKKGEARTVLAPGVVKTEPVPDENVAVGSTAAGVITFDATMDMTKDASKVITAAGLAGTESCGSVSDAKWTSATELSFKFKANAAGYAFLQIEPSEALADPKSGYANKLDGNQKPPQKVNRVAPNGDAFKWIVVCKSS